MVEVSQEIRQEEEEIKKESQEELTEEEIVKLVNKALKQGVEEAKFILKLDEWKRPGGSFRDYGKINIVYGQVEAIELDSKYDYPTTSLTTYAIIPKTKTVIMLFQHGDDYEGKLQSHETLYVFSYTIGWKSLDLD